MNRFRQLVCGGILGLILAGMTPTSTLAAEWVSLFDGQSLSGWTKVEGWRGGSTWEVVDGVIVGSGQASMLYSPKGDYKNFRFRAEIKINDRGNSGMYFRCPVADGDFAKGYEAQIDSTHSDPIRTGSLYGFLHVYKQLVPPDTWFTYEVQVVDKNWRGMVIPHIKISINGEVLYEFLDRTKAWDKGYFAFQQHDPGSKVQIRKIEVMELDEKGK
jgi:3-keto-disaccharide hydrolase